MRLSDCRMIRQPESSQTLKERNQSMTEKEEVAKSMVECVGSHGLIETIYGVFGKKAKVSIPMSKTICDSSVEELDLSQRARNGLHRDGCFTIGQLVDLVNADGIRRIRNLGEKSQREIHDKLLEYTYVALTETEKRGFFLDMIDKNTVRKS